MHYFTFFLYESGTWVTKKLAPRWIKWKYFQQYCYGSIKLAKEGLDILRKKTLVSAMEEKKILKNELLKTISHENRYHF